MNENHIDVIRQCDQCPATDSDRDSPPTQRKPGGELGLKQRTHVFSVIRWSGDDHNVDNGIGGDAHRIDQHRGAGDCRMAFVFGTEAFTLTCCGNRAAAPVANVVAHDELIRSQDLVEDGLGLVLVGLLRERQLADQDLARLGKHAPSRRQATLLLSTEQVPDHFGDLDDVTGCQLLQIGLVSTRPQGPSVYG